MLLVEHAVALQTSRRLRDRQRRPAECARHQLQAEPCAPVGFHYQTQRCRAQPKTLLRVDTPKTTGARDKPIPALRPAHHRRGHILQSKRQGMTAATNSPRQGTPAQEIRALARDAEPRQSQRDVRCDQESGERQAGPRESGCDSKRHAILNTHSDTAMRGAALFVYFASSFSLATCSTLTSRSRSYDKPRSGASRSR